MTASLHFSPRDRVLVFAPHPDDETIATGELVQAARAAGAAVRVVFATDGENNPWPQRWLERRWRIGAAERARWGERRRREGIQALAVLGLDEAGAHFLGWPDQGLTERLMRDDRAVAALAAEVAAFMPTHVAMPTLADRHPDHGALRVMLDLALLRAGAECVRLGYTVHGSSPMGPCCVPASDPAQRDRKRQAMQAHLSQIALSGDRLLRLAARTEIFEVVASPRRAPVDAAAAVRIRLRHRPGWWRRRPSELLLLLTTQHETVRYRCALPRLPRRGGVPTTLFGADGRVLHVVWEVGALSVTLPEHADPFIAIHAKLDRIGPRLVIFDHERWHDCADLLREPSAGVHRHAAAAAG